MILSIILIATVTETAGLDTLPTREKNTLVYFDMIHALSTMPQDSVLQYDTLKAVSALQGLVNRERPRLFIRFLDGEGPNAPINIDDYWLEKIRPVLLPDYDIQNINTLETLFTAFSEDIPGYILWDPSVAATSNVASTACGVDGFLPIRAGSPLINYLQSCGIEVKIKEDLSGLFDGSETGSPKCDAYLWAKRRYLDTGKCNPSLMAFYIDAYTQRPGEPGYQYTDLPNSTLANHDYYIAHKAFFFDLLVWPDECPVDDPAQSPGTDRRTLISLLEAQYRQNGGKAFTSVGGFVSWDLKYTNYGVAGGTHEPVPTEWEYVALFSAYNAFLDADALGLVCLPNASVYSHFPLKNHYEQHSRPETPPLEDKTYVLIYMGDYDSAAWMSRNIPRVWDDPERGKLPIAWAFNPNLSDRIPQAFDYIYTTATPNDWFIGGDSGAGYLNPNLLTGKRLNSGLPEALTLWEAHNTRYYKQFDYTITGFVINGFHGDMPLDIQKVYARFSPDGVGMQLGFEQALVGETPFIRHTSDIYPKTENISSTADEMAHFSSVTKPQFLVFRWILQTPTTMKLVYENLQERHGDQSWVFCDPYTFFALYREHLKKQINR